MDENPTPPAQTPEPNTTPTEAVPAAPSVVPSAPATDSPVAPPATPTADPAVTPTVAATPPSPAAAPDTDANAGKHVLIIEDEPFISELYVRALGKAGYNVKVVIDGQDALQEAKSNSYDIILLDIMLPNLTGTEILRRLRDVRETPNLHAKIIVTTNLELGEESRAAIEAQADGYIVKAEITPKELATFLDQLRLNQPTSTSTPPPPTTA